MIWVSSNKEFQDFLKKQNEGKIIILFKHSTRCPVSAQAYREIARFSEVKSEDYEIVGINVINDKAFSQERQRN